jgi:hypothetical protein
MIDLTKFKYIPNFGNYMISEEGFIYSTVAKRLLKINLERFKKYKIYISVSLRCNGKEYKKLLHRLVAITYISNPENKATVNHIDGNKYNNNVKNLEWLTQQEQVKHVIENNLKKKKQHRSPIVRITKDGLVTHYDGVLDASIKENINQPNITRWLTGTRNPLDKSKWLYKSDYEMKDKNVEKWKEVIIDTKKTGYFISDKGRLKYNNVIRKGAVLSCGYHHYSMTINGIKKHYISHRLVAIAFLEEPPIKNMSVDHINRIREDNRVENLRWATAKEQAANMKTTEVGAKKKVIMYSKDGKKLKTFDSSRDAYKFLMKKDGRGTSIVKVCRKKREFAYGYRWSYEEDQENYEERKVSRQNYDQPIIKILNGVKTRYLNINDAFEKENMKDIGRIRLYIRKKRSPPPDGSEWFLEYELNKNN